MKTFKDLEFQSKSKLYNLGEHAGLTFENGYGVSVITGPGSISDEYEPYEVAVMNDGGIDYSTGITDDIIGHCDEVEVTRIMKLIQEL